MMNRVVFLIALASLAACASTPDKTAAETSDPSMMSNMSSAAKSAAVQTREGFTDAALSPLEDLNLMRDEIPERLAIMESPYVLPVDITCEDIARRVTQLNALLGNDFDTPKGGDKLRSQRLADGTAGAALNALSSEARGLIPFRGVVRYASGASKHEKKSKRAYEIGSLRRAYLKGIGLTMGCAAPARPMAMPSRIIAQDRAGIDAPVIVGIPQATSSDPVVTTRTSVEVPDEMVSDHPVITYRREAPTSSQPNAPITPSAALQTPPQE